MQIYYFSRYESKWKPLNGARAKSLQKAKDYMNTLSGHYRLIPYCVCVVKKWR